MKNKILAFFYDPNRQRLTVEALLLLIALCLIIPEILIGL